MPVAAQKFVGVQAAPGTHVAHTWEAEQYWFATVPQVAPAGSHVWGTHTGDPVVQEVVAVAAQRLSAAQSAPEVHGLQIPAPLHTWFGPQEIPAATGVVSTHTGEPDVQEIAPFMQVFVGVQAAPGVHARHCPEALQTAPVPHGVPGGRRPVSVQTGDPEPQAMAPPAEQGFPVEQVVPGVQALQTPAPEQTWPVPHEVPGAT